MNGTENLKVWYFQKKLRRKRKTNFINYINKKGNIYHGDQGNTVR